MGSAVGRTRERGRGVGGFYVADSLAVAVQVARSNGSDSPVWLMGCQHLAQIISGLRPFSFAVPIRL